VQCSNASGNCKERTWACALRKLGFFTACGFGILAGSLPAKWRAAAD
jgi:hypothetical protein